MRRFHALPDFPELVRQFPLCFGKRSFVEGSDILDLDEGEAAAISLAVDLRAALTQVIALRADYRRLFPERLHVSVVADRLIFG